MQQPRAVSGTPLNSESPGPAPLVQVKGVTLQYKTPEHLVTATYRVGFDIFPAERYVILGPSGCGKSTILKAIAGFIKPVEGEILLKGKPITDPGPDRLMVFQEFDQLLPWKTVKQNVMFPMIENGVPRATAEARAGDALAKVNRAKRRVLHKPVLPNILRVVLWAEMGKSISRPQASPGGPQIA